MKGILIEDGSGNKYYTRKDEWYDPIRRKFNHLIFPIGKYNDSYILLKYKDKYRVELFERPRNGFVFKRKNWVALRELDFYPYPKDIFNNAIFHNAIRFKNAFRLLCYIITH